MDLIKAAKDVLLQYNNYARNKWGDNAENSLLRGYIILLASQFSTIQVNQYDIDIREILSELHSKYPELIDNVSFLDTNYHDDFLKHIFITFSNENSKLTKKDLLDVLDWILSNEQIELATIPSTPREIVSLMTYLVLSDRDVSVFDPAMGTGSFLASVQSQQRNISFTGIEISKTSCLISRIRAFLLDNKNLQIFNSNSFTALEYGRQLFDIVLTNPPIKRLSQESINQRRSYSPYHSSEESINFINLSLDHLKKNGKAAFLVGLQILFNQFLKEDRKNWLCRGLKYVISLPANLLLNTRMKCAILIFDSTYICDSIKFIELEDKTIDQKYRNILDINNIAEILNRVNNINDGIIAKEVNVQEIVKNDYQLVPNLYLMKQIAGMSFSLSEISKPLDELAEIIQGGKFSRCYEGDESIIKGANIRVEYLELEELERKDLSNYPKAIPRTKPLDILLQRIGNGPAAYLVQDHEGGIAVADTVFIIRFREKDKALLTFITQYLNSEECKFNFKNKCIAHVIPTLSRNIIKSILVPVPDNRIINIINEMQIIENDLKKEYEKAAQLRKSVFGHINESDMTTNFDKIRFTSFSLKNALAQKDDIDYKIRTLFPFPLAYPYRNIYNEREYAAIYDRQMKYGENLLSFLASIGMSSLVHYEGELEESIESFFIEFQDSLKKGISPGHWRSFLQKSCILLRSVGTEQFPTMFSALWFKGGSKKESEFATMTEAFIVKPLNDSKHHRGPTNSYEFKKAVEEQKTRILNIMESLELLGQYDFIIIDDIDNDWNTNDMLYRGNLLKGDHPLFKRIEFSSKQKLTKGKIYIKSKDEYISLYPFINFEYNTETKREEVFTFDKKDRSGRVMLKSFDSGSSTILENIESDFNRLVCRDV